MRIGIELIGKQFSKNSLPRKKFQGCLRPIPILLSLSIPQINSLITFIGKDTYDQVLKNGKSGELAREDLTPALFRSIKFLDL